MPRVSKMDLVVTTIRHRINSGQWPRGMRIPSTKELQELFTVSYGTLRPALLLLKQEGLIYGVPGEGTYVRREEPNAERDGE